MDRIEKNLCISLFYEKSHWHRMVLEAIYPYIYCNKDILDYTLQLSIYRGEHIRLTLLVQSVAGMEVLKKVDKTFKKYLKENPSPTTKSITPDNGFFLNFRNNSVHYGAFETVDFKYVFKPKKHLLNGITEVIFQLFQEYGNDTMDYYMEIFLQLLSKYIKAFFETKSQALKILDDLLFEERNTFNESTLLKLDVLNAENFAINKKQLEDLIAWNAIERPENLNSNWIETWCNALEKVKGSKKDENSAMDYFQENKNLIKTIADSMAFQERLTAYYFLRETINNS